MVLICKPGEPPVADAYMGVRFSGYVITRDSGSIPPEWCFVIRERQKISVKQNRVRKYVHELSI